MEKNLDIFKFSKDSSVFTFLRIYLEICIKLCDNPSYRRLLQIVAAADSFTAQWFYYFFQYATLGKMSFSVLGSIGSMIEIILILYPPLNYYLVVSNYRLFILLSGSEVCISADLYRPIVPRPYSLL